LASGDVDYRVYFLGGTHIVDVAALTGADDAEAVGKAKAFGRELELWLRDGLVARIDSKGNVILAQPPVT
jgi:hypothetical protein